MIQMQTMLDVADNTGAKAVQCFKVLGGSKRQFAGIGDIIIGGVMEHVEEAGIHSGDSCCVLPPHTLSTELIEEIKRATRAMAQELGVDVPTEVRAAVFSGNQVPSGAAPLAQLYAGHQFGNWAGQLGDGRAINLGELVNGHGERWALQLKGAGPTPYSRTADGLAVLRSSVRRVYMRILFCFPWIHW